MSFPDGLSPSPLGLLGLCLPTMLPQSPVAGQGELFFSSWREQPTLHGGIISWSPIGVTQSHLYFSRQA